MKNTVELSDEELLIELQGLMEINNSGRNDRLLCIVDEIKQRFEHYRDHQTAKNPEGCDLCWLKAPLNDEEKKAINMAKFFDNTEGYKKLGEAMSSVIYERLHTPIQKPLVTQIYEAMVKDGYGKFLKPICACGHSQPCVVDSCGCCKCEEDYGYK